MLVPFQGLSVAQPDTSGITALTVAHGPFILNAIEWLTGFIFSWESRSLSLYILNIVIFLMLPLLWPFMIIQTLMVLICLFSPRPSQLRPSWLQIYNLLDPIFQVPRLQMRTTLFSRSLKKQYISLKAHFLKLFFSLWSLFLKACQDTCTFYLKSGY